MTIRLSLLPLLLLATLSAFAEGTRTWEQSKYDEFEKGTARGVAIRSDGALQLAPAFQSLATTPSTYIWSIASGPDGAVYVAAGSPARVYRVTPDGKSTALLQPQELQVQALTVDAKGTVYAATSPDGRVYRIERDATQASGWKSSTFFEPRTKYIWDLALDREGRLYVATGDHGEIFRVEPNGTGSLFFKSDEAHIRRLAFDTKGNLIAGSDGSGLVYRLSPTGEAFVLYSANKKEITALAIDAAGNLFAAGVGEKRSSTGTQPVAAVIPQAAMQNPPAAAAPGGAISIPLMPPALGPVGSEVYRIATDGSTTRLWSSKDETVYALGFDSRGHLLIGTGNKGRIFSVQDAHDSADLLKASASQVTGFARAANGALYVSTSNLGKLFLLSSAPSAEGTYESDVFDARNFSRWGRAEVRATGTFELWARSGNVDNPDRNWSPWTRVDMTKGAELNVPAARFAQWKAVLRPGTPEPTIDSVLLNYLPKNVAPVIDEVTVQPSAHFGAGNLATGGTRSDTTPATVRDRNSVAVRWSAHDDNDDQLVYTIYYRGDRETRWKLLKSGIKDKFYSLDASLLPDGGYTIKVVASDAPSHSPGEALTNERVSQHFELDTTPPRIEGLSATARSNTLQVSFRAIDSSSVIKRAEYSVDAGDWTYIEPVGQLSDKSTEDYQFSAPLPPAADGSATGEHVVVVRVWDRFDNLGTAKAVLSAR